MTLSAITPRLRYVDIAEWRYEWIISWQYQNVYISDDSGVVVTASERCHCEPSGAAVVQELHPASRLLCWTSTPHEPWPAGWHLHLLPHHTHQDSLALVRPLLYKQTIPEDGTLFSHLYFLVDPSLLKSVKHVRPGNVPKKFGSSHLAFKRHPSATPKLKFVILILKCLLGCGSMNLECQFR